MAETFVTRCPKCGKKLLAPAIHVGKSAKCPQCSQEFQLRPQEGNGGPSASGGMPVTTATPTAAASSPAAPAKSPPPLPNPAPQPPAASAPPSAPAPQPAPTAASQQADPAEWYVQTADGSQYGPVTQADLDNWLAEDRLDADCQILRQGWAQWQWAEAVYPQLAPAGTNPFASPGVQPDSGHSVAVKASTTQPAVTMDQDLASWVRLSVGLTVSQYALAVAGGCFLLLAILVLAASGGPTNPFQKLEQIHSLTIISTLDGIAIFMSVCVIMTGWAICATAPRESNSQIWINMALGAGGGVILTLLLLLILGMLGTDMPPMAIKFLIWISLTLLFAGYTGFAFFLAAYTTTFGNRSLKDWSLIVGILQGVSAVWFTVAVFILPDSAMSPKWHLFLMFMLLAVSLGSLAFMAFTASTGLRRLLRSRG